MGGLTDPDQEWPARLGLGKGQRHVGASNDGKPHLVDLPADL